MQDDVFKTKVVFKMVPEAPGCSRACIAFLLDVPTSAGIHIMTYMHVGQHSEAYTGFYYELKPATPDEYADLKEELESTGYELEILKKCNAWAYSRKNFRKIH